MDRFLFLIKRIIKGYIMLLVITMCISVLFLVLYLCYQPVFYTDDISDYLRITGNYDNDTPAQFVNSFFPEEISPAFSKVAYHYYAKMFDSYGFEAYLSFTIEDTEQYDLYKTVFLNQESVTGYCTSDEKLLTGFDGAVIDNELVLRQLSDDYSVSHANWGRILYSDTEQQFVFVAIGVCDGGGTKISELNHFFTHYKLDPVNFASDIY